MAVSQQIRVAIVAEHASARFGGEALLPLQYFKRLRARGVEAWLVCHARVRDELVTTLPSEIDRMRFIDEDRVHVGLWKLGRRLPAQAALITSGSLSHFYTQRKQCELVRQLVRDHGINVIHEPIPVSPAMPSATWNVGAPVIIGPMNGAMTYPPGFRRRHHIVERAALRAARSAANVANLLIPGKRHARLLLVANARTRAGLPSVLGDVPVEELVENGVDLGDFVPAERSNDDSVASMAFVGRLVDWKGVDLLLGALHEVVKSAPVHLGIFGDGPLRADLEHLTQRLGLTSAVTFHGFVPQQDMPARLRDARALVLPSLYECGGAVVLEAMALGLPVIATRWGGPADYLDATCGILVEPHSREQMIRDLARAMSALSQNAELRAHLGAGAREKALRYDWDAKIDRMLQLYARVAG